MHFLGAVLSEQPGGKGATQAAAAAQLGGRARLVGAVGDDAQGRKMLDALSAPASTLPMWPFCWSRPGRR